MDVKLERDGNSKGRISDEDGGRSASCRIRRPFRRGRGDREGPCARRREGEENRRSPWTVTEEKRGTEVLVGARSARRLKFGWLSRAAPLLPSLCLSLALSHVAEGRGNCAIERGGKGRTKIASGTERRVGSSEREGNELKGENERRLEDRTKMAVPLVNQRREEWETS